jgi:predicted MFS family arabinose efflux permease
VDVLGAATFTVASAALVYGLVSAGERGWGATATVVALVLAAAALVGFVVVERRAEAPMLDLALFANPSFAALMVAAAVLSAAAFSHLALVSLWLQSVLGLSPIRAGLVVIPLSVASFVVSATAGRFLHGGSPARPVAGGLALIGAGVLLMTLVGPTSGPWALFAGLVVAGLGVGLATPVLVSATLAVLPPHRAGVGSAAVNTFRQLGLAVGLAVLGTVFAGRVASVLAGSGVADPSATANALAGGRAGQVPVGAGTVHAAFAAGLDTVFTVAGVAALVAAVLVAVWVRPAPVSAASPERAAAAS